MNSLVECDEGKSFTISDLTRQCTGLHIKSCGSAVTKHRTSRSRDKKVERALQQEQFSIVATKEATRKEHRRWWAHPAQKVRRTGKARQVDRAPLLLLHRRGVEAQPRKPKSRMHVGDVELPMRSSQTKRTARRNKVTQIKLFVRNGWNKDMRGCMCLCVVADEESCRAFIRSFGRQLCTGRNLWWFRCLGSSALKEAGALSRLKYLPCSSEPHVVRIV